MSPTKRYGKGGKTQGSSSLSELVAEYRRLYRVTEDLRDDAGLDRMHHRELDDAVSEYRADRTGDQSDYAIDQRRTSGRSVLYMMSW